MLCTFRDVLFSKHLWLRTRLKDSGVPMIFSDFIENDVGKENESRGTNVEGTAGMKYFCHTIVCAFL